MLPNVATTEGNVYSYSITFAFEDKASPTNKSNTLPPTEISNTFLIDGFALSPRERAKLDFELSYQSLIMSGITWFLPMKIIKSRHEYDQPWAEYRHD